MPKKATGPRVRIIGSRELHRNLPAIMHDLEAHDARFVLTVHGKPKAVLIGAAAYLDLVRGQSPTGDDLIELQLSALLGTPSALPAESLTLEPGPAPQVDPS